nr:hypothetical protein [SPHINX/BMMF group 1 DNA sequence]
MEVKLMNINLTFLAQIIQIIGCLCSLWVYIDASGHKIGRTPQGGLSNIGAGWWGVLSFLLWIVIFPLYLIKRKKLIALAKTYPIEPKARKFKIIIFVLICALLIFF